MHDEVAGTYHMHIKSRELIFRVLIGKKSRGVLIFMTMAAW